MAAGELVAGGWATYVAHGDGRIYVIDDDERDLGDGELVRDLVPISGPRMVPEVPGAPGMWRLWRGRVANGARVTFTERELVPLDGVP